MASNQVIVVGGGLSGLSAAHTVIEQGGRVLLLDKNSFLGGNSTKATSGINGALTRTQIAKEIKDSVEQFEADTALSANGGVKGPVTPLVKVLAAESAPAVEWLMGKFELDLSLVSRLGGHSFPRTHRGKERFPGMTITYALMERLEEIEKQSAGQTAKIVTKARVTRLIRSPDGHVTGVEYEKDGQSHSASGPVILATGGYGADFSKDSLLQKFRPDLAHLPTTNGDHCTGDGIKMAEEVGAGTVDMNYVQVHPTGLVNPDEPDAKVKFLAAEALRGVGGMLLDANGERFCNELGRRDYVTGEMWKNKGPFRLILNSAASKEIEWHCKHYCGRGLMRKFESGDAIAKDMGIPASKLAESFAKYNDVWKNNNCPYGKKYFHNMPINMNDTFHVAFVTPVVHYCMGGLFVNHEAEVLEASGKPIPGLYATGEVMGGVHGKNRLGGNSLLDCVVYGRVSGRTVSRYFLQNLDRFGAGGAGPEGRALAIARHLDPNVASIGATVNQPGLSTSVQVVPSQRRVSLELTWDDKGTPVPTKVTTNGIPTTGAPPAAAAAAPATAPAAPAAEKKGYTLEEVAKHNTEKDCWVVVNGQVLDVTNFLGDHPGGKKAIMLFAGKDASEEFNMLHKPDVVEKYAPECVLGPLVEGGAAPAAAAAEAPARPSSHSVPGPVRNDNNSEGGEVPKATGKIDEPNNGMALHPLQKTVPSNTPSRNSGGTSEVLPAERAKASFVTEKLTNFLDGSEAKTKRRRFIISPTKGMDLPDKYFWSRERAMQEHVKHFIEVHEEFWGKITPTREEAAWMSEYSMMGGSLMNHYGLFLPTILAQANDEQQGWWLIRTLCCQIIGSYAQTELGHGSNVRGLQTIAEYDKKAQEFVLNTPTLTSMKWWPGTLGKIATHAIVYAQLLIDGKEYGVQSFMVQIRDQNHRPLPGIELGDLGPKVGDAANDTGFMRLENIRIPREHMFARYQEVTPEGKFERSAKKTNDKLQYVTMMFTRGVMVKTAGGFLARAATIATRYSCVRRQGFVDTTSRTYKATERQIIDYGVQRYRILRQLALAYAIKFSGKWMVDKFSDVDFIQSGYMDTTSLPEIAATSAGLKALCTYLCSQGIEDCRKCCGGNGYLLSSGIAQLSCDYVWQTTAEGDFVILILQTARFLMKSLQRAQKGEAVSGPVEYLSALKDSKFDVFKSPPPAAKSAAEYMDIDFLIRLFRHRALTAVVVAGGQVQKLMSKGLSYDDAMNQSALLLFQAVTAHCHAFMLHNFVNAVPEAEKLDRPTGAALRRVCALYACSNMLDDQWYGLLPGNQLRLVQSAVHDLLDAIRPDAVALTDAFDFPDRVLNSTIGGFDGNVYEALYESAKRNPLNHVDPFPGYDENLRPYLDLEFLEVGNGKIPAHL